MWKVTENDVNLDTLMTRAVVQANKNFPEYHTRKMLKDFIQTYGTTYGTYGTYLSKLTDFIQVFQGCLA